MLECGEVVNMGSLELVLMHELIIKKRSGMIVNISFQLVKSKLFSPTDLWREKKYSILGIFYIS